MKTSLVSRTGPSEAQFDETAFEFLELDPEAGEASVFETEGLDLAAAAASSRGVAEGSLTKEKVCWLQNILNLAAGEQLTTDGAFGSLSRAAVRRFQSRSGLAADGLVGPKTETALVQAGLNEIAKASLVPVNGVLDERTRTEIRAFQASQGLAADGVVGPATRAAMITALGGRCLGSTPTPSIPSTPTPSAPPAGGACRSGFRPRAVESPGGGRVTNKTAPPRSSLVKVPGASGSISLHPLAAEAWQALVEAARADGISHPLLLPTSGFRDPDTQRVLWERALERYGSAKEARKWVAPPGSSAHQSGRAIDFYLGGKNSSGNVANLRRLPAYQWLVQNAACFGFYPYSAEPWHWEYNPPAGGQGELIGTGFDERPLRAAGILGGTQEFGDEPFAAFESEWEAPEDLEFARRRPSLRPRAQSPTRLRRPAFRPRPSRPPRPPRRPLRPRWPTRSSVVIQPPWPVPTMGGEPSAPGMEPASGGASAGSEFTRWVQESLNQILDSQLPVDGLMTPETRQAIRDFQTRMGLPVDGIVGPDTQQALVAERQKQPATAPPGGSDTELFEGFDWSASGEFDLETPEPMNEYELTDAELAAESRRARRRPRPRSPSETDLLRSAIRNGTTNENQLADLIFFRRHPERSGRLISRSEPGFTQLSQEWLQIRDTLVRPLLRGTPRTPSTPTAPPPPSVSPPPPPPPPSGPPAAGEPQVTINSGVLVSDNAVRVLKELLRMAGLTRATITSGRRTSTDQARIMYDLIERHGVPYAKDLYGSYGDQVIDVYSAQKAAGQSATAIKQAMEAKIVALGPSKVSHHCSDTHDVMDVAPSSLANPAAFQAALDTALRSGMIDKYIPPPGDPAFHIEIVLNPTANELTAGIFRSPPLPLDAFVPTGTLFEMD